MMEGLRSNNALIQHVYEFYSPQLKHDDRTQAALFSDLHAMYKSEANSARKTEIMGWICEFANTHEYPKAHEQLYDLAWDFNLTLNDIQKIISRDRFFKSWNFDGSDHFQQSHHYGRIESYNRVYFISKLQRDKFHDLPG